MKTVRVPLLRLILQPTTSRIQSKNTSLSTAMIGLIGFRQEDCVKRDVKEVCCENVNLTELAEDRV
jgi:hypothetical protein